MDKNKNSPDQIGIKKEKGLWKRFVLLFAKCRLPWVWILLYIALEVFFVDLGIDVTEKTAELFAGNTSAELLFTLIAMIIGNLLLSNITVFARQMTSARTDRNMRNVVFSKLLKLPMSFFKDENPRDGTYRIVSNCGVLSNTLIFVLIPIGTCFYKVSKIAIRVFSYDWRFTVILIGFVPLQILLAFIFGRINFWLSQRETNITSKLVNKLAEIINNIPAAKAFAREDRESKRSGELIDRLYKINIKSSWIDQLSDVSQTIVSLVQTAILVAAGILLLQNQSINTRAWITFFSFSTIFTGGVYEFCMYWNNVKVIQGSSDRIGEIVNAIQEKNDGEPCNNISGNLVVSNLKFGYSDETELFHGMNCTFQDNCVTALLGPSGCGKTTLSNILMRMYDVQNGQITVQGKDIRDYCLDDWRNQFVMVSQNTMLFSGSILENVQYGNGNVSRDAVEDALKQSGAWSFVSEFPEGMDHKLEEYGGNLSGGQKQKLSVARALLSNAHYVILDEPISAMDAISASEFLSTVQKVFQGRCIIIIGHTPMVLHLATRAVIIENGVVTADGDIKDLISTNAFLRSFTEGGETV